MAKSTAESVIHKSKFKEPYLEIEGGRKLEGETTIPGAKNAALPALVAACLSTEKVVLNNVPVELNDIQMMISLLESAGANIKVENDRVICDGSNWKGGNLDPSIANKIRHSLLLLGASARWNKQLYLPLPGGCEIGQRKHDLHINALDKIGHEINELEDGLMIHPQKRNDQIFIEFYYPTFGGTLNVLFASVQSDSANPKKVILKNAAINPEVQDVIKLLNSMGTDIKWTNENTLEINSVKQLHGTDYMVMSDRIVAATVIAAVGITQGEALLKNATTTVLQNEVEAWKEAGLHISEHNQGIYVKYARPLTSVSITTEAYPGFHTDIQPLHAVLMCFADGISTIKETILDGRFLYCYELNKMGANIEIADGGFKCVNGAEGQIANIQGVHRLKGSNLIATDIRGGAAVAVAALAAEGTSTISNIYQLERGYSHFNQLFQELGAKVNKKNIN